VFVTTAPELHPEVVAPPFASAQSGVPDPEIVPAVSTFVSVP